MKAFQAAIKETADYVSSTAVAMAKRFLTGPSLSIENPKTWAAD